jgi:hypothetical protein
LPDKYSTDFAQITSETRELKHVAAIEKRPLTFSSLNHKSNILINLLQIPVVIFYNSLFWGPPHSLLTGKPEKDIEASRCKRVVAKATVANITSS